MRKALIPFLSLFLIINSVFPVYASASVDLESLPEALADQLGISDFSGGILTSALFLLMFVLPVAIWRRGFMASLFMCFLTICFEVAVGWLPYWILIMMTLIIAGLYASKLSKWAK